MPRRTITPTPFDRWAVLGGSSLLVLLAACGSGKKAAEVEVEVMRVALDEASRSPVVVLQDRAHHVALPIWVGLAEAQSIAMQLEGIQAPRPLTHDLMKNVLDQIGVEFQRVLIHELRDGTYLARIILRTDGGDIEVDSRPSDGIALAVRFDKPIFVAAALLEQARVLDTRAVAGDTLTMAGMTVQGLNADLVEYFDLPDGHGVLVADVRADGPLRRGDVILEVEGRPVRDLEDFRLEMKGRAGQVNLQVLRGDERLRLAYDASRR